MIEQNKDAPVVLTDNGKDYFWVVVSCPFCGDKHQHYGGTIGEDPRKMLGPRTPHCADYNEKYVLDEFEQKPSRRQPCFIAQNLKDYVRPDPKDRWG